MPPSQKKSKKPAPATFGSSIPAHLNYPGANDPPFRLRVEHYFEQLRHSPRQRGHSGQHAQAIYGENFAEVKGRWLARGAQMVPNGKIPVLGQKPEEGSASAYTLFDIPDDDNKLSIRLFPGGVQRFQRILFFDFVTTAWGKTRGVPMPAGYGVYQMMPNELVALQGVTQVFGAPVPDVGESFTVMEDVQVVVKRVGKDDFVFSTKIKE
ncbi:hypothetical protein C8F01DRAFT_1378564 [Mycena amicta]|nr:hypothetical protein C8F01DRAFT_1378564 [Mycena amicta]